MFKHLKSVLVLLMTVLLMSAFACSRDENVPVKISSSMAGMILENATALRISPFVFSGCITRMDKSTVTVILERSAEKSQIGKSRDYWYHVRLTDGITGWVYGGNIRIFDAEDSGKLTEMLSRLQKDGDDETVRDISGKWWTISSSGDFTNICLELYPDGKFRAYKKGGEEKAVEGQFSADSSRNELLFSPDSGCFGEKLKFQRRGDGFSMAVPGPAGIKFKRIHKIVETAQDPEADDASEKKEDSQKKESVTAGEQKVPDGQKEE